MDDTEYCIRLAEAEDLPDLHLVIERAYRGEAARGGWTHEADLIEGARIDLATLETILEDEAARLLVVETEDRLIGCVQVTDLSDDRAYLGLLCVDPAHQAAGIGRLLLDEGEALAAASFGAERIEMTVIDVRTELIAYYERRGYQLTGERRAFPIPLDPPLEMVVLEKALR
ncbi:Ribosomal protein S18 acetylase RimI [Sphingomonas guangdongensis]|uniref:Ribosomal protein S18 acetylase RimI n=1 Tax=Sphingomonas guangdongensis TaxID=1141890 RepID=A0A285R208_9SPHN|nr:GNAT family N-acetyltransferase [Sphingomonas guangdongensis]SOB87749.1 Ribosomal protein S18 acetylase RimI [Sphingomonas guangdongensis]